MTSSLKQALLPLRPRPLWWGCATALVGLVLISLAPHAFYYIEAGQMSIARGISPFEYVPILVSVLLVLGISTGFDDWDRYGARQVALVSTALSIIAATSGVLVFFAGLALYPADGEPPAAELLPILNNVTAASLLAVVLIGPLGRLLGTLTFGAAVWTNYLLQARAHPIAEWLPLTWYHHADLTFDRGIRWGWLAALAILALIVSWRGRYARLPLLNRS